MSNNEILKAKNLKYKSMTIVSNYSNNSFKFDNFLLNKKILT